MTHSHTTKEIQHKSSSNLLHVSDVHCDSAQEFSAALSSETKIRREKNVVSSSSSDNNKTQRESREVQIRVNKNKGKSDGQSKDKDESGTPSASQRIKTVTNERDGGATHTQRPQKNEVRQKTGKKDAITTTDSSSKKVESKEEVVTMQNTELDEEACEYEQIFASEEWLDKAEALVCEEQRDEEGALVCGEERDEEACELSDSLLQQASMLVATHATTQEREVRLDTENHSALQETLAINCSEIKTDEMLLNAIEEKVMQIKEGITYHDTTKATQNDEQSNLQLLNFKMQVQDVAYNTQGSALEKINSQQIISQQTIHSKNFAQAQSEQSAPDSAQASYTSNIRVTIESDTSNSFNSQESSQSFTNEEGGAEYYAQQIVNNSQPLNAKTSAQLAAIEAAADKSSVNSLSSNLSMAKSAMQEVSEVFIANLSGILSASLWQRSDGAMVVKIGETSSKYSFVADQIIETVNICKVMTPRKITIQMNPSCLGEISINLEYGLDGKIKKLNFACAHSDTMWMLQQDARELKHAVTQIAPDAEMYFSQSESSFLNQQNHGSEQQQNNARNAYAQHLSGDAYIEDSRSDVEDEIMMRS
ncbi:hypothetical protein Sarmat_00811 [Rickettsiales endosymbiont of Paramecium tredecaurelia]|uniref:hypothetical protein n=1 Tax=Candidatus Sarmatiella mevalonica TaxID=2770581 RepID=UPI001924B02E|nr:hypothetical protein [Candidatus Sarmatiella mevalonica]MBL3284951.1 hypothetical protein [Candidatus Sarmatiella mevalonica]